MKYLTFLAPSHSKKNHCNQGKCEIFDIPRTLSQQEMHWVSCPAGTSLPSVRVPPARKRPVVVHRRREIPEPCQGRCGMRRRRANSPQHPGLGEAILAPGTCWQPQGHQDGATVPSFSQPTVKSCEIEMETFHVDES